MTEKIILLVEDEAIIALNEARMLARNGYRVITARSGEQAFEIALSAPSIDLVLMDIDLGSRHMDGTQAAALILAQRDLPIVFLSGHTEPEVVAKTEGITSYGYIVKNSGETVLLASIKMAFKLFEANQALRLTNDRLSQAQAASQAGAWSWDILHNTYIWSPEFLHVLGMPAGTLPSLESWAQVLHPADRETAMRAILDVIEQHIDLLTDYRILRPDGEVRWIRATGRTYYAGDRPVHMAGLCMDITERKQAEEILALESVRLQTQLELHKQAGSTRSQLLDYALEALLRTTQSQFAFIGLMDPTESSMTIHSWSKDAMAQCAIQSWPLKFPIAKAGLWGECVRQRRPVIVNDYAASPQRRGVPGGHVPIQRFLGAPIFDGDRIVAVAATANKAGPYTESDGTALTILTDRLWGVLERKCADDALQKRTTELNERVKELDCLYRLSSLVETHGDSLETILQEIPRLIPPAWQHPEITCARLTLEDRTYQTDNYQETPWQYTCLIAVHGRPVGQLQVGYLEERPPAGPGAPAPFSRDEQRLAQAIAERLGRIIERMHTQAMLAQSEEKFSKAFQRAPVLMAITAIEDGRFISVNDEFVRISGFSQEEAVGRTSLELGWLRPPDRARLIEQLHAHGRVAAAELTVYPKDGSPLDCLYNGEIIIIAGQPCLLSLAQPITGHGHPAAPQAVQVC